MPAKKTGSALDKYPNLKKGNRFKKGESGNSIGSSRKKRSRAAIKRIQPLLAEAAPYLTVENLRLIIGGILMGSKEDVKETLKGEGDQVVVLYELMASCVSACARKGDIAGLMKLFEIVLGKTPDRVEVTGKNGAPFAVQATSQSVEDMQKELEEIRKRKKAQGV